jgi:hypothetical protein
MSECIETVKRVTNKHHNSLQALRDENKLLEQKIKHITDDSLWLNGRVFSFVVRTFGCPFALYSNRRRLCRPPYHRMHTSQCPNKLKISCCMLFDCVIL